MSSLMLPSLNGTFISARIRNGFALNILFGQFQKCHDDSFVMVGNGNVWDYPRMRRDGKDWQRPRLM